MKRLYISDVVHEHLKKEAQREGRTLQWVVEERLTGTPPIAERVKESPPVYNISTDEISSNVRPDVQGAKFVPRAPDPNTGYPCCEKNTPCKHWAWDGDISAWKNSLTGKTREV